MKHLLILISAVFLASCTNSKSLYTWNDYDKTSYVYLKNADEKSIEDILETYQKIINDQKGSRVVTPPGIYADYGFLLIERGKIEDGKEMLLKEIALYPESKIFIELVLSRISE